MYGFAWKTARIFKTDPPILQNKQTPALKVSYEIKIQNHIKHKAEAKQGQIKRTIPSQPLFCQMNPPPLCFCRARFLVLFVADDDKHEKVRC